MNCRPRALSFSISTFPSVLPYHSFDLGGKLTAGMTINRQRWSLVAFLVLLSSGLVYMYLSQFGFLQHVAMRPVAVSSLTASGKSRMVRAELSKLTEPLGPRSIPPEVLVRSDGVSSKPTVAQGPPSNPKKLVNDVSAKPIVVLGSQSSPPKRRVKVNWARDRHPCRRHFLDICGNTRQMTFNKSLLVPKWPKPQEISGLRQAIAEHNERQKKACEGKIPNPRLLVYACERGGGGLGSGCHAFGDGYRGITLGFVLAALEKRSFFMYTPSWIPFEKIFPPRMNYRLENCSALATPETMQAIKRHHVTFNMQSDSDKDGNCPRLGSAGLIGDGDRVLGMNGNQVYECWYRLLRETGHPAERIKHESVMRLVWETMFDFPGKELEDTFQSFLRSEQIDLDHSVCLHVRSGSFTGVDAGCFYKNFDDVWRCARALEIASDKLSSLQRTTWVIIGDNDLHKQMALDYIENCSKSDPLFAQSSVQRRVVDTSNFGGLGTTGASTSLGQQRRVFFDLLVMSRCRHLVAQQSGFSGMAAILHRDWSERHFVRVNKFSTPVQDVNKICVSELGYDYG